MARIEIFYPSGGEARNYLFTDWTKTSDPTRRPRELVSTFTLEVDAEGQRAAELAFTILNSYPNELYCPASYLATVTAWRELKQRSMCVGDVVVADGVALICAEFGFRELSNDDLAGVMRPT